MNTPNPNPAPQYSGAVEFLPRRVRQVIYLAVAVVSTVAMALPDGPVTATVIRIAASLGSLFGSALALANLPAKKD